MAEQLTERKCKPCSGDTPPLSEQEIERLHRQVPAWNVTSEHKLVKQFQCKDFMDAIDFVNRVARIAEEEDHHPSITVDYKRVTFTIWTHAINDLTENDFILAAKIDEAFKG